MLEQKKDIPIVVLAGGEGNRMGTIDKCLLKLGSLTLLERLMITLKKQSTNIILNVNGDKSRFKDYSLTVVNDMFTPPIGPLGGLLAALKVARTKGAHWCVTVPGDCPFIPDNLLDTLFSTVESHDSHKLDVVFCSSAGRDHYITALWSVHLYEKLIQFIESGQRSVRHFIVQQKYQKSVFDTSPIDPFFNINTPEQWQEAERYIYHYE
ncbi:molybdenum cofactor guanylyltransferase MobA [Agarilytica rhodophyticola]|uniref:molybdenum cofactor guanylyltransferase MobA n=1 Tax=Agarilytica rhodophyticola TaxID=1737490 RepID=UPI000B349CF7|nr:molybdenum cofactor guanylyltransferase MobA [Agarilytica rhodophyticola]